MNALLALEQTVGVVALKSDGDRLNARFFAGQKIHDFGLDVMRFRPAQIHAFEHFGPVLSLGAARAGMDVQKCIHMIGFAAEQHGHFRFVQQLFQKIGLFVQRFQGFLLAVGNETEPFLHFIVAGLERKRATSPSRRLFSLSTGVSFS